MKAGFIGYRGFVKKLEHLFKSTVPDLEILFYHPDKRLSDRTFTNTLSDLFCCDFIVIGSPDTTHFDYIKKLEPFSGYIFCEKVPATDLKQLGYLEKQKNNNLYFNFNYRKSMLSEILQRNSDEMLYINVIFSIGIALRDNYRLDWRSSTPLGVLQTSGIHILDLLLYTFGQPLSYNYHTSKISAYGNSVDNFSLNMVFNTRNRLKADLYFSYTAPYVNRIDLISTEKLIQIKDDRIETRGPREYIRNGRFYLPPVIETKHINHYDASLLESIKYFIATIKKKGKFSETINAKNYLGNRFLLTLEKEITG